MSFEQNIQKWVSLDNKIKILNDNLNQLREQRAELSKSLYTYAERNNLNNANIQISDGKLKFVTSKVSNPLSFKYVEKSLGEIISNEEQVKKIVNYLKENREFKNVQELKRFSNNSSTSSTTSQY
jgi:hypothetical protein|uniref:Uncharacterized protein n=1 Tax=viral metagenome TaxID=1070528 RepID=A0A6C0DF37_9ZZZZ